MSLLRKILLIEILKGLSLTLKKLLFHKPVTIQFPEKDYVIPAPGFRGRHALVRDPNTGDTLCIACMRCVKVCPSKCIYIEYEVNVNERKRRITRYDIDALRCVYCGYCEEVCPVNAIVLTEYFTYIGFTREELYFDKEALLKNWDEFISTQKRPYMNPFWKPRGYPEKLLPIKKREFKGV